LISRCGQLIHPSIKHDTCENIDLAVNRVMVWLCPNWQSGGDIPSLILKIRWKPSPAVWKAIGFHHVELSTVFVDPRGLPVETTVHEIAHILDNRLGPHPLASIFGGGPSDDMLRSLGVEPDQFFPRFSAPGYERTLTNAGCELNPIPYGRSKGPAEDFAESFSLAVLQPDKLAFFAPQRFAWFQSWRNRLVLWLKNPNTINRSIID
jgi:hypothetical protein